MATTNNKARVLIIDDNPVMLKTVGAMLGTEYDILIAKGGEKGLQSAEKYIPDLILLDIIMPGLTGFEVIEILKKEDTTKNIPVIFLSGDDAQESREKGYSLGAVDYIEKPFVAEDVFSSVKKHLQNDI